MEGKRASYLDPKDWNIGPCWQVRGCRAEWRAECPAWQYQAGQGCWEVSGTYCQGKSLSTQAEKRKLCRQCEVFQATLVESKK